MTIDHVFMFIQKDSSAINLLKTLGFTETYRRKHVGQGTANVCYAFNNLFLEFIWLEDVNEAISEDIKPTGLFERSLWESNQSCPFGFAYRCDLGDEKLPVLHWAFRPHYLPYGGKIDVTEDSKNPKNPMVFEAISKSSPIDWPSEKKGLLQSKLNLEDISEIKVFTPRNYILSDSLAELSKMISFLKVEVSDSASWSIVFEISNSDDNVKNSKICFPLLKNSFVC